MEINGLVGTGRPRDSIRSASLFSLEHASRTLPLVRRIVRDIVEQYKNVGDLEEKSHPSEPGVAEEDLESLRMEYGAELERLQQLTDELSALGCVRGDWCRGIVDFRTVYQGRQVELCWRLGEDKIEHWHELDAGLHDRHPIDAAFIAGARLSESGAKNP